MMVGGIYDPVSLVDHAGFGAVKPDNALSGHEVGDPARYGTRGRSMHCLE